MNSKDWMAIVNFTYDRICELSRTKGEEYKRGDDDQFANFKRRAAETGVTMLQVWHVFFSKHIDSITTYIKDDAKGERRTFSEPIAGRIDDAIVYLLLLKGMVEEIEAANRPRTFNTLTGKPEEAAVDATTPATRLMDAVQTERKGPRDDRIGVRGDVGGDPVIPGRYWQVLRDVAFIDQSTPACLMKFGDLWYEDGHGFYVSHVSALSPGVRMADFTTHVTKYDRATLSVVQTNKGLSLLHKSDRLDSALRALRDNVMLTLITDAATGNDIGVK